MCLIDLVNLLNMKIIAVFTVKISFAVRCSCCLQVKRFTTYCSVLESDPSGQQGLLSEDQVEESHANAFSQKQCQKSGSIQRSKSDRYRHRAATLSHHSPRPDLVTVNL